MTRFPGLLAFAVALVSTSSYAVAPTVTTNSATSVTAATAFLNGQVNPGGESTQAWFRRSTTNPTTCDDNFGVRVPGAGGTDVGSGSATVNYNLQTTGLSPGTTYWYCAIAQNTSGTAFGALVSFTTPALAPTTVSDAATNVTSNSAQLNGSATPNGASTDGFFRYSATNPFSCNTFFGSRVPISGGTALGSGSAGVAFSQTISGLSPGTTYYYCAQATNSQGTTTGVLLSFTTLTAAPVTTTTSSSSVTGTTATLSGQANPGGAATTGWFRIASSDPGSCNDAFGTRVPMSGGSSLGGGVNPVSFNQGASGLSPNTTYYFCAIAQNAVATTFGAVLSFTTGAAPLTTTLPVTVFGSSTATLRGEATPNRLSTTGWFRYASVNPGLCDDSFGVRAPSSGGTGLGTGTSPVLYTNALSGLLPGTTYYYCAIAQNFEGITYGGINTFTTDALAPAVGTNSVTLLTGSTVTLNGSANPRGAAATGHFRYATASPGTCNDFFGTRAPAAGGTSLGNGNSTVAYSVGLTGLTPGTTYFYCAIASNAIGTGVGGVLQFTTPMLPTVTTVAGSSSNGISATLSGQANPNLASTTGWFRISTTNPIACDDLFGTRIPVSGGSALGAGSSPVSFGQTATGLLPGTTYYLCAIAQNAEGTGVGAPVTFTTPNLPTIATVAASSLTPTTATLNGTGSANGSSTSGYFRYSTVSPGTCNDSFGTRTPSFGGTTLTTGTNYASTISTVPGTTYFFCAIATNSVGTSVGAVLGFTAPPAIPAVSTGSVTLLTGTSATLNGTANPGGAATTGYFRYATSSPGTCNDTFGTRLPGMVGSGSALGAGNASVAFSQPLSGLTPGTTYFYCALGNNSAGTGVGSVFQFTTPTAPIVTTGSSTVSSGTAATILGSAVPGGAAATGYFRFGLVNPGTCDDSYGTRSPTSGGSSLGSGNFSVNYNTALTGLTPGTTYFYCAAATNSVGTTFGAVQQFTTLAAPTIVTDPAVSVTATTATLTARGTANGANTTGWFRYATTNPGTCNDSFGARAPISGGNALGAGFVEVPFSVSPSGLLPGTTYFFCAIGSNVVGMSFGAVLSFTTPALAPTVTTVGTTSVLDTSATINGSGTARGAPTTGWFRYSTMNPTVCNDTFGTRVPSPVGTDLGSGNTATAFSQALTGLSPNTTYYYCAIAQNSVGLTLGTLLSFTTIALPTVTTSAASPVTATTATLNGSANPNGSTTTGWYRYATTNPGSCDDTFGTRVPTTGGTALGAGTVAQPYTRGLSGLLPGTQYYFCAIANNAAGLAYGALLSFTTPPTAPATNTLAPTAITGTGATLNGSANPNGASTTGWFRYSTSNPINCNDVFGTRAPGGTTELNVGGGNTTLPFNIAVTGLTTGTTYYYCAIAKNSVATTFGTVQTFTTPGLPTVTTVVATGVGSTVATLNGSANPNLASTTGYFRYATTSPGSCNDTFGTRAPASGGTDLGSGSLAASYTQAVSGLLPGTTYYYCAIAQNVVGAGFGSVQQFTTTTAPSVTTDPATLVTGTTATLNGTANPNGSATGAWFRYSSLDPGSCNDSFGTRTPSTPATNLALGNGSAPVSFNRALTGLFSGTTYYYCALASSAAGTSFGAVLTFTTPGTPLVTSVTASAIGATTANLNGTANPRGATTTGFFRYSTINPGSCTTTFGTRAPSSGGTNVGAGSSAQPYTQALMGLSPATTYYYCAQASNVVGTGVGTVMSFTTLAAPAVTTSAATVLTGTRRSSTARPTPAATRRRAGSAIPRRTPRPVTTASARGHRPAAARAWAAA